MSKRRWILLLLAILVLAFGCVQIIGVEPGTLRDGGSGGSACTPCSGPADCPATDCAPTGLCIQGCCTYSYAQANTSCNQGSGVCDGMGSCVECVGAGDCASVDCKDVSCSNGNCLYTNAAPGTTCGSDGLQMCDNTGTCSF